MKKEEQQLLDELFYSISLDSSAYLEIVNKDAYDILKKYDCLEELEYHLNNNTIMSYDIVDYLSVFRNNKIVKIIKNGKVNDFNNLPINQIILIDYSSDNIDDFNLKYKSYIAKYNINPIDSVLGIIKKDSTDLVIMMHKDNFDDDYKTITDLIKNKKIYTKK